eukprot:TRINITY_DN9916_c0_g1_i3.p1 TRINITY_DN9916_c0_g1~~TRINITY_DN9916_c0_g1_i3.p1  ORF type:complete len:335 (+),score=62.72 TRINITY_DN9916_c0_g1_i3:228-1232(+)
MMSASNSMQSRYFSVPINKDSHTDNDRREMQCSNIRLSGCVQNWSVQDVTNWLQKITPFEKNRHEELLQIFGRENVDGQILLNLKRDHKACSGMTDLEWALFKAHANILEETKADRSNNIKSVLPGTSKVPKFSRSQSTYPSKTSKTTSLLRLFSVPRVHWKSNIPKGHQNKELEAEVEALREEIASFDERETKIQAQLEHVDELLRSAKLATYLYIRTRWLPLPGEPPVDETDVNDWVEKFVVLHGSCIFFYLHSTDISPQDSVLLEEIVEAGSMLPYIEDYSGICWYSFQITSCHGVRFECSTRYKYQVDCWSTAIKMESKGSRSFPAKTDL